MLRVQLTDESFKDVCRQHGYKVTPQRVAIFKAATESMDHPTVDSIYEGLRHSVPGISRETVYRTLELYSNWGLISAVQIGGQSLRYDSNTQRHHHCVCDRCGRLFDFEWTSFEELSLPQGMNKIGKTQNRTVEIHGICTDCLNTGNESANKS